MRSLSRLALAPVAARRSCKRLPSLAALVASSAVFNVACLGDDPGVEDDEQETRSLEERPLESRPATTVSPPARPNDASENSEGAPDPSGLDDSSADGENDSDTPPVVTEGTEDAAADVVATEHCQDVADWDPEWVAFEEEVLALVNEQRSSPADCGTEGQFEAAPPLTMDPILRCSARLHSLDMFERDFFDHTNPDGVDPFQRMDEAGFVGSGGGENIAVGQTTPEAVMAAWMESDGHCANVMRPVFSTLGVGFHPGEGRAGIGSNYWTQNFGAPPFMSGRRP